MSVFFIANKIICKYKWYVSSSIYLCLSVCLSPCTDPNNSTGMGGPRIDDRVYYRVWGLFSVTLRCKFKIPFSQILSLFKEHVTFLSLYHTISGVCIWKYRFARAILKKNNSMQLCDIINLWNARFSFIFF